MSVQSVGINCQRINSVERGLELSTRVLELRVQTSYLFFIRVPLSISLSLEGIVLVRAL